MRKLLIIDGSSKLSTSFYGTLDRRYHMEKTEEGKQEYLDKLLRLHNGEPVNGVYTMAKSIEAMIKKVNPSHVAIAWDVSRNTFRREIYPEYKGHRADTIPELKSQFALANKFFEELGIPQFSFEKYEADDILGTFSKMFEDEIPVTIWTKDQDAIQLISDRTSLWLDTSKAKEMYAEEGLDTKDMAIPFGVYEHNPYSIEEYYNITPIQIIDLKAIEGDTSDNIPGIKGVGKKTVLPLINEFGTLEEIYNYLESDTAAEMKDFFKDLGIPSPLKKMMDEIRPMDIIDELAAAICANVDTISDKSFDVIGYSEGTDGIDGETIAKDLRTLEEKDLKKIFRALKKETSLVSVLEKVGEFNSGKAKEIAFMSKVLATIERDIEELKDVKLSQLEFTNDIEKKSEVFKKYDFKSLIK